MDSEELSFFEGKTHALQGIKIKELLPNKSCEHVRVCSYAAQLRLELAQNDNGTRKDSYQKCPTTNDN